ncbi:hypothetical protein PY32053_01228 [Paracoccus yeei]|uniref:Uncharacterized protein n=1 Tax=Paracoccus yeei TaxID=147645 RepID=A0A386UKP4_9RHOB|nr:hypothetical protein PY32053_01228 [Paracoccus yeei]
MDVVIIRPTNAGVANCSFFPRRKARVGHGVKGALLKMK